MVNDVDAVTTSKSFLSTVPVNLNKAASKTTILRLKGWQYIDIIKPPARDTADSTAFVEQNRKFKPALIGISSQLCRPSAGVLKPQLTA